MGKHRPTHRDFAFNFSFVRATWKLAGMVYPRLEYAAFFTAITLLTALGREVVNYYSGLNLGKFYGALIGNDESVFWNVFTQSTLMYVALCFLIALVTFFSWCLYIAFRKNVVERLQKDYFGNGIYYRLNCIDDEGVDNPDQRVTQDVDKACSLLAINIIPVAILAPFTVGWYTWKTWSSAGWFGVMIVYVYFVIGTVINRLLLSPLAKWAARVERAEGDFRYKHVSVRDHSEEVAFYRAAGFEEFTTYGLFFTLLRVLRGQILWKFPSQFFQIFFNYFGGSLSYVFPVFIFNSYAGMSPTDLGTVISNNAFVYITLINSFTNLTDLATSVGEFAGYVQRIAEFADAAESLAASGPSISSASLKPDLEENEKGKAEGGYENDGISRTSEVVEVSKLCYAPPTEKNELIRDLSFSISYDKRLLIRGPSGVGKTSLLRCLARLWPCRSGHLSMGSQPRGVLFLPQVPYFPVGRLSLRQQVVFPRLSREIPDQENACVISILHSLGLARLLMVAGDLTTPVDFEWQEQLSPGEAQRLSLARVLFHRPSIVFLDEATSSLSEKAEREAYLLLGQAGIHYVSTGHRSTLLAYHDQVLQLESEGHGVLYDTSELRF